MDDDMKELHHDNYPSQSEMQEWLEANREIYTDFKSKIQSILKNLLCDNYSKQIDDEANKLQSIILEIMTTEEGAATDEMIDKFSNAIEDIHQHQAVQHRQQRSAQQADSGISRQYPQGEVLYPYRPHGEKRDMDIT